MRGLAFLICAMLPGAALALFVTSTALTMPSMIGMIMLMGIATKNSILLVEYAIVAQREQGLSRLDALLDACHKRARPIVMTTIAMAAGMVPPLAMSAATFLRSRLFTKAEVENGRSAWLLGLSFISEGATPFAATLDEAAVQFCSELLLFCNDAIAPRASPAQQQA